MSTVTSPDGILVVQSGDTDGYETGMAALAGTVQDALDTRQIHTYAVADATALAALSGTYTLVEGDLADQADTDAKYRWSGSAWAVVAAGPFTLIATGTITAQSAFNFDSLTGYDEYEIVLNLPTSSTSNSINMFVRASSTNDTSANYDYEQNLASSTSSTASNTTGGTSWAAINYIAREDKAIFVRVFSLNAVARTVAKCDAMSSNATASAVVAVDHLRHRSATAWTGVGFTTSTGTVTGTYAITGKKYA